MPAGGQKKPACMVLGAPKVGKTSLVTRFFEGQFSNEYQSTLGMDQHHRTFNGQPMQILDTAGSQDYHTMVTSTFKTAKAFMLVYDVTNQKSFDDVVVKMRKDINDYARHFKVLFLVANKIDLEPRVILEEAGEDAANQMREAWKDQGAVVMYRECSAKNDDGVKEMFTEFCTEVAKASAEQAEPTKPSSPNPCCILQ